MDLIAKQRSDFLEDILLKFYNILLSKLNNSGKYGYNLSVHLYKFEEYAVPQKRHRYIIVGIRGDLNLNFEVPKPNNVLGLVDTAALI